MTRPTSISEYIASAPMTHRASLKKLNTQIKKLYPKATRHISYGMPLYKLDGHPLAGFRAAKKHIGVFVWSGSALATLGTLLKKYDTSQGTVRFAPNASLPATVLKAVLKARELEIAARWPKPKTTPRAKASVPKTPR